MATSLREQLLAQLSPSLFASNALASEAERFFFSDLKSTVPFHEALLDIAGDPALPEPTRLAAVLIAKRLLEFNWQELGGGVQDFYVAHLPPAILRGSNLKVGRLLVECFHKLLLKRYPLRWPSLLPFLETALSVEALTPDAFYFALLMLVKVANFHQWQNKQEKSPFLARVPELLRLVWTNLGKLLAASHPHTLVYIEVTAKLLVRIFKAAPLDYFYHPEATKVWFEYFLGLVLGNFKVAQGAAKWALRLVAIFFRKTCGHSESETLPAAEWLTVWTQAFYSVLLGIGHQFAPATDSPKVFFALTDCFIYANQNEQLKTRFRQQLLSFVGDSLLPNIEFTAAQVAVLEADQLEMFRQIEDNGQEDSVRSAAFHILSSITFKGFLLAEVVQVVFQKIVPKSPTEPPQKLILRQEAALFVLERFVSRLEFLQQKETEILEVVQKLAIPFLDHASPLLRMRSCSFLKEVFKYGIWNNHFAAHKKDIVRKLCGMFSDSQFYVRGAVALALGSFLQDGDVVEMIRPNLADLLRESVFLIREYETQPLIDAFREICVVFETDIGPFLGDLLQEICGLLIPLLENRSLEEGNEQQKKAERSTAAKSLCSSLTELVRLHQDPQGIEKSAKALGPVIIATVIENEADIFADLIRSNALLVKASASNSVCGALLEYFIFACCLFQKQPIPSAAAPTYSALTQAVLARFEVDLTVVLESLRVFYEKASKQIFGVDSEFSTLFSLQLTSLGSQKVSFDKFRIPTPYYHALVQANSLVAFLKDGRADRTGPLLEPMLQFSWIQLQHHPDNLVASSLFAHNLGLCFLTNWTEALNSWQRFAGGQSFLEPWVQAHKKTFVYKLRKASFFGLCAALNRPFPPELQSERDALVPPLVALLAADVFVLRYLAELEEKIRDDDESFYSDDEENGEESTPALGAYFFSVGRLKREIHDTYEESGFEMDQLRDLDSEFTGDPIDSLSQGQWLREQLAALAQTWSGLKGCLLTALATLDESAREVFDEEVGSVPE